MRGIGSAINGLLEFVGDLGVPRWAVFVVLAVAVWYLIPRIAHSIEMDRARRIVKGAAGADPSAQARASEDALAVAGEDPDGLVVLADEAVRLGKTELANETLARLRATGMRPRDVQRIELAMLGPLPASSLEAALAVERLLDTGASEMARDKLSRFLVRWPDDHELRALAERAAAEAPPGEA